MGWIKLKEGNFLDRVMEFEQQLGSMHKQFRDLMGFVAEMTEENHSLQLENHHLRKRLEEMDEQVQQSTKKQHTRKEDRIQLTLEKASTIWPAFTTKAFMFAMSITGVLVKGKTVFSACLF